MLLRALEYARPESVEEVTQPVAREGARPLAGGRSLINARKPQRRR
jgi:CO/xanthine dehydrogenase FAD-binding subunit